MSPHEGGRRHLLDGTAWGLIGEGLALPTGLATVIFLTRTIGASDYGLYVLTFGTVLLLQSGLSSLLGRATIKFLSEAKDPGPVLVTVLRLYVGLGTALGLAVAGAAPLVASVLGEPELTRLLRIYAIALPVGALAEAHLMALVGLGRYRRRALARAIYWISRLLLIVGLVLAGFGVAGALLATVGAGLVMLVVARRVVRPSMVGLANPVAPLLAFAAPLFLAGVGRIVSHRIDIFAFKAMGGTADQAGHYGAAQNLALIPTMLGAAFAPLLLSSMSRALSENRSDHARSLATDFLRIPLLLTPVGAAGAGAAAGVVRLAYGTEFLPAGSYLSWLVFVGVAGLVTSTIGAVLLVLDRTWTILALSLVSLVVSVASFLILIPDYGGVGAAAGTLLGTVVSLVLGLVIIHRLWGVHLPVGTTLRAALIAPLAWLAAGLGPMEGLPFVAKLLAITVGIGLLFAATGEFTLAEFRTLRDELRHRLGFGPGATPPPGQ